LSAGCFFSTLLSARLTTSSAALSPAIWGERTRAFAGFARGRFASDQEALDEALKVIEEDGIETFAQPDEG